MCKSFIDYFQNAFLSSAIVAYVELESEDEAFNYSNRTFLTE